MAGYDDNDRDGDAEDGERPDVKVSEPKGGKSSRPWLR
jgi:hypothetical protein